MLPAHLFIDTARVEERTVELGDGTSEVLHFKHLPNTAFERYAIWTNSADEEVRASAPARLVELGLCDADGKPSLTREQAERLKRPVLLRLVTALLDVNGYGKAAPGNA